MILEQQIYSKSFVVSNKIHIVVAFNFCDILNACALFHVKIPTLDVEVKLIPIGIACAVAVILAQANVTVILAGGVGKNGSTVAVR